jgi:hypothetical protein
MTGRVDLDLDTMGPVDVVVVDFPADRRPDASAFHHLTEMVHSGLIRILELRLLRGGEGGAVVGIELDEAGFDHPGDLESLMATAPSLLSDDQVVAAGAGLGVGSVGVLVVYENRWVAPFAVALRQTGALLLADRRIPIQAFLASLGR